MPDSVDILVLENRLVKAIKTVPVVEGIPHHVVAGDWGRGGAPDLRGGLPPYRSTHMNTAESEWIVPSGHGTHQNPEGIDEVRRMLRLHAGVIRQAEKEGNGRG